MQISELYEDVLIICIKYIAIFLKLTSYFV